MVKAIRKLFMLDITPDEKKAFFASRSKNNFWRILVPLPIIAATEVQNLYLFYTDSPAVTSPIMDQLSWMMLAVCAFYIVAVPLVLRGVWKGIRLENALVISFWAAFIACMMFFAVTELQSKHTSYNFIIMLIAVAVLPLLNLWEVTALLTASTTIYLLIARGIYRDPFHVQVITCYEIIAVIVSQMLYIGAKRSFVLRHELKEQSDHDVLTGLLNRRGMEDRLVSLRAAAGTGAPLGVMMIDVDHFKLFNDTYGHVYGDYCLQGISAFLRSFVWPRNGIAVRYGGEEAAVYIPVEDTAALLRFAKEIQDGLRAIDFATDEHGGKTNISVSIGVDLYPAAPGDTTAMALNRADKSLYVAKEDGRDRVALHEKTVIAPRKETLASGEV